MLLLALPMMAAEVTEPEIDYSSYFVSLSALVVAVPFVVEAIKKLIPPLGAGGLVSQITSWVVGILIVMFGWWMELGFLAGIDWYIALAYGIGVSLASNGIFDTCFIEWIVGLFKKKSAD